MKVQALWYFDVMEKDCLTKNKYVLVLSLIVIWIMLPDIDMNINISSLSFTRVWVWWPPSHYQFTTRHRMWSVAFLYFLTYISFPLNCCTWIDITCFIHFEIIEYFLVEFQSNQTILGVMGSDVTTSEMQDFTPWRQVRLEYKLMNNFYIKTLLFHSTHY